MKQKPRYITLPEDWSELTKADWCEALKIRHLLATSDHQWTMKDVRIETARMLLNNRGVKTQVDNPQYLILVTQLAESLTWLWMEHDGALSLVYRSTVNLLPKVRSWLGPMSHGEDLMFGEFRQAVAHLKIYEQSQNPEAFCALAGLLYRPEASEEQRHQGLLRQSYDWDSLDDKIRRGRAMKPWQRWGIYAWFAYFCEYLTTGAFTIDGEQVSFAPLFSHNESVAKTEGRGSTMTQICHTLAETHVFGTAREVDRTPLLTVMQKLLQDYYTLQELKKAKTTKKIKD